MTDLDTVAKLTDEFLARARVTNRSRESLIELLFTASARYALNESDIIELLSGTKPAPLNGNIFDGINAHQLPAAERMSRHILAGKNVQASSGAGELAFLSWMGGKMSSVANADVELDGKHFDIKTPYGRLGISSGHTVTGRMLHLADLDGIGMPLDRQGRPSFVPFRSSSQCLPDYLRLVQLFVKAATASDCELQSEEAMARHLVRAIAIGYFESIDGIIVLHQNGDYRTYHSADEVVEQAFSSEWMSMFEIRSYQSNPIAIYMKNL